MDPHFFRGYSDRSHFVQSLKRLHFSYSWQKKKKNHENKEIMSRIKTTMKSKNSKRRLIKKIQEEMKIKNKVNVERTFMRERERERDFSRFI